jgi:hypothetical protein
MNPRGDRADEHHDDKQHFGADGAGAMATIQRHSDPQRGRQQRGDAVAIRSQLAAVVVCIKKMNIIVY